MASVIGARVHACAFGRSHSNANGEKAVGYSFVNLLFPISRHNFHSVSSSYFMGGDWTRKPTFFYLDLSSKFDVDSPNFTDITSVTTTTFNATSAYSCSAALGNKIWFYGGGVPPRI